MGCSVASIRRCLLLMLPFLALASPITAVTAKELTFGVLHNDGAITDILYYRNNLWEEISDLKASSFSRWYRVNTASNINPIRTVKVRSWGTGGDCNEVDWAIQTDADISSSTGEHSSTWLANRSDGYAWSTFENVTFVVSRSDDTRLARVKEIPASLLPLAVNIKSRWSEMERAVITKMVAPEHHSKIKGEISSTPPLHFAVERTVWTESNITVFYFHAMKIFHSPFIPKNFLYDGENLFIDYRGWAVLYPNGRIAWPSAFVHLMPSGENAVEPYQRVHPAALLEIDGHQYLIARSDTDSGKGVTIFKEVFELVDGKFKSRRRYLGSCT